MLQISAPKIQNRTPHLKKRIHEGTIWSLGRAGAYLRGIAMKSIKKSQKYSQPGKVPHTRRGQLRRALWFDVDRKHGNVVIGPRASWITTIGSTHEFGKTENEIKRNVASNWRINLGGHGPIDGELREMFGGKGGQATFRWLRFAKLRTAAQVERARRVVEGFRKGEAGMEVGDDGRVYRVVRGVRRYPERPFMSPALEIAKERLPSFWAKSVTD